MTKSTQMLLLGVLIGWGGPKIVGMAMAKAK